MIGRAKNILVISLCYRSVEEARNADFRDSDILLATYPKTGIYFVYSLQTLELYHAVQYLRALVESKKHLETFGSGYFLN